MLTPQTLVQVHEALNSETELLSWGQIKILQCFVPLFEVFDFLCFLEGSWRFIPTDIIRFCLFAVCTSFLQRLKSLHE